MLNAYTKTNLGDDLFIKSVCERYPNTKFILYAPENYNKLKKRYKNLRVYRSNSILNKVINYSFRKLGISYVYNRRRIAKKCDASIYIGGSLFMQYDNWKEKYIFKKEMYIKNKPFFLIGANFGPYKTKEYYEKYYNLFSNFTDICFREKYSYDLFEKLNQVRYASDIIFNMKVDKKTERNNNTKNIVISVIKPSKKHIKGYDKTYYNGIKSIILHLIKNGHNVTMVSFCKPEGDEIAINEILNLIPEKYKISIKTHFYDLDIDKSLEVISEADLVVATRFHAMILGWLYGIPVFPISYSNKMENIIDDIGFKGPYIKLEDMSSVNPDLILECMGNEVIDITEQKIDSERHFAKLDNYIN